MRSHTASRARLALALALTAVGAACAGGDAGDADTGAAGMGAADTSAAAPAAAAAADTGMAGMDHSAIAANRGPAKDADHEFLRMMSDHHQGLVAMMDGAMQKATGAEAKTDAHELHTKQAEERDRMVAMISTSYGETIQPMVMPSNKAMNDSLQQKSGAEYDRDMYRHVVMHHREGIQMIDRFLPRLQNAEVRAMAEKMRADQQREIPEFERKAGGTS